jgi:alpha-ketoglutarate-dependent taurine dioxygenase
MDDAGIYGAPRLDRTTWCNLAKGALAGFGSPTGADVVALARDGRGAIESRLWEHGALLFRGGARRGPAFLREFIESTSGPPTAYEERSSPRTEVGDRIYTSTDYPEDQEIFLHNEHSYAQTFPTKLYFHCVTPSREGGQTPIAECRKVLGRLAPSTRAKFERRGWMYVRNFGGGVGLDWREAFRSDDKSTVERYCAANGIEWEWTRNGLRTRQRRPVIAIHPKTAEEVWFNHVAFFHVTTLPEDLCKGLMASFREADLPNNTYYGDGSPIEHDVLEEIRRCYLAERMLFDWRPGDVLMIDNLLVAHGRMPFAGPREVLVGMSEPCVRKPL